MVAALVCLYAGFLLFAIGGVLMELVSPLLGGAIMTLGWVAAFAIKFLLLAAIITSLDKKGPRKS